MTKTAAGTKLGEVRIKGVPDHIKKQLKNISRSMGIGISDFMKPKLREIVDSYPEDYREGRKL